MVEARAAALRFADALLVVEVRPGRRAARAAVRRNATASLASEILAAAPRPLAGLHPQPGRVVAAEALARAGEFAVTVRRGRVETGLIVKTAKRGARWIASDLR